MTKETIARKGVEALVSVEPAASSTGNAGHSEIDIRHSGGQRIVHTRHVAAPPVQARFFLALRRGPHFRKLTHEHCIPRLHVELQRLGTAVAHCADLHAHVACELIRGVVAALEDLS